MHWQPTDSDPLAEFKSEPEAPRREPTIVTEGLSPLPPGAIAARADEIVNTVLLIVGAALLGGVLFLLLAAAR